MNRVPRAASRLLVLSTVFVSAQQPHTSLTARPQLVSKNAGVSADRLARIDAVLQRYVVENRIVGAYGSWCRVGPDERLVIVLIIQLMANETDIREKFPTLVYQALDGAPRTGSH
jgi:hypothetical protein